MATSAAASYEVRFRAAGTTDNWSDIQDFKPGQEIKLTSTNRARSYDAQARSVSRCGARSAWVPVTVIVDDANQRVSQSNISMLTVGGIRSAWSGLAIAYTSTPTSATISCTAGTLRDGGTNPSYSASSVTVSGAAGTSATYWLYYDDPRGVGGTFPLGATTTYEDLSANGSRVWVGNVVVSYPATGTGGGGGGTGGGGVGCVEVDAIVLVIDEHGNVAPKRAGDIVVGNQLWGADEVTLEAKIFTVSYSEAKLQPAVEINAAGAARLRCSTSAPIPTPDGLRTAPNVAGKQLASRGWTSDGAGTWVDVGVVRGVGEILVQHITAQNGCFWAASDGKNFILHHNLKNLPENP